MTVAPAEIKLNTVQLFKKKYNIIALQLSIEVYIDNLINAFLSSRLRPPFFIVCIVFIRSVKKGK